MADDTTGTPSPDSEAEQTDKADVNPTPETSADAPAHDETAQDDGGDRAHAPAEDDDPADAGWRRVVLNAVNASVLGTLVLAYEERDVKMVVDGDAALRILTIAQNSERREQLADELDPARSPATHGWIVLRPKQPLAISWYPLAPGHERSRPVAIDPLPL